MSAPFSKDWARRFARRTFGASLMSDTKWRKVFGAAERAGIQRIRVKFIDVDEVREIGLPWMQAPAGWVDTMEFGPIEPLDIEWIEVAAAYVPKLGVVTPQALAEFKAELTKSGQFPLEENGTDLRIWGHVLPKT